MSITRQSDEGSNDLLRNAKLIYIGLMMKQYEKLLISAELFQRKNSENPDARLDEEKLHAAIMEFRQLKSRWRDLSRKTNDDPVTTQELSLFTDNDLVKVRGAIKDAIVTNNDEVKIEIFSRGLLTIDSLTIGNVKTLVTSLEKQKELLQGDIDQARHFLDTLAVIHDTAVTRENRERRDRLNQSLEELKKRVSAHPHLMENDFAVYEKDLKHCQTLMQDIKKQIVDMAIEDMRIIESLLKNPVRDENVLDTLWQSYFDKSNNYALSRLFTNNLHAGSAIDPDNQDRDYRLAYNQLLETAEITRSLLIKHKKIVLSEKTQITSRESIGDHIKELTWIADHADQYSAGIIRDRFGKYYDPETGNMQVMYESLSGKDVMKLKSEMHARFETARSELIQRGIIGNTRLKQQTTEAQARKQFKELQKQTSRFEESVKKAYKKSAYSPKQAGALKAQYQLICRLSHEMEANGAYKIIQSREAREKKSGKKTETAGHVQSVIRAFDRVNFDNRITFFESHPFVREIQSAELKAKELSDWLYDYLRGNPEFISGQQAKMTVAEINRINHQIQEMLANGKDTAKKYKGGEFKQFLQDYIRDKPAAVEKANQQINQFYADRLTEVIEGLLRRIDAYLQSINKDQDNIEKLKEYKAYLQSIQKEHARSQYRNFTQAGKVYDIQRDMGLIESLMNRQLNIAKQAGHIESTINEKLRDISARLPTAETGFESYQKDRLAGIRERNQEVNVRMAARIANMDLTPLHEPQARIKDRLDKLGSMLAVSSRQIKWDQLEAAQSDEIRKSIRGKIGDTKDALAMLASEYAEAFKYGHSSIADMQALLGKLEPVRKKIPSVKTPADIDKIMSTIVALLHSELKAIKAKKINAKAALASQINQEIEAASSKTTTAAPEKSAYEPQRAAHAALARLHDHAVRIRDMRHGLTESLVRKNEGDLLEIEALAPKMENYASSISALLTILGHHARHDADFKEFYDAAVDVSGMPLEHPEIEDRIVQIIQRYTEMIAQKLDALKAAPSSGQYWEEFRFLSQLLKEFDVTHPVRYAIDQTLERYEEDHAERIRFEQEREKVLLRLDKITRSNSEAILTPLNQWDIFRQKTQASSNKNQTMEHVSTAYKGDLAKHQLFIKEQGKILAQNIKMAAELTEDIQSLKHDASNASDLLDRMSSLITRMENRIERVNLFRETLDEQIVAAQEDLKAVKQLKSQLSRIINHPDFQKIDAAIEQFKQKKQLMEELKQARHTFSEFSGDLGKADARAELNQKLKQAAILCSSCQTDEAQPALRSIKSMQDTLASLDSISHLTQALHSKAFFNNLGHSENQKLLRQFLESIPEKFWLRNKNVDTVMKACLSPNADINNITGYIELDTYIEKIQSQAREKLETLSQDISTLEASLGRSLDGSSEKLLHDQQLISDYQAARSLLGEVNAMSLQTERQLEIARLCPHPGHVKAMLGTHQNVLEALPAIQQQAVQLSEKYKQQKTQKLVVKPEIAEKHQQLSSVGMFAHHQAPKKPRSKPDISPHPGSGPKNQ
ncbi:hypothetical protein AQUSIP_18850 [Aquicella siphonis]|uniref:Uncharacterized protein n=1 Tax=Aquicella siphonis TaxID=254247 RepID=A0A5E4PHS7_9COXI|nr:hypothetical protein [Aquicella siphonis]VVC76569.1 hypothetical protein AQUSIP_18850 [Aquicella siphonis]